MFTEIQIACDSYSKIFGELNLFQYQIEFACYGDARSLHCIASGNIKHLSIGPPLRKDVQVILQDRNPWGILYFNSGHNHQQRDKQII